MQSLNRLRHIAQVLTRHGFGHIVTQINLTRFVPVWMLPKKVSERPLEEGASAVGRRLAMVCAELGPTFIKLGQMVSSRPDIVPPEVLKELCTLQDDVPPFDTSVAMDIISEELGRPVDECFASLDEKPIASASIGQVYRGRLKDGPKVMVKVRRPDIEQIIRLDMQLLSWIADSLESFMPELRVYRPSMLVSELKEMLTRELDYVNEASTTARFAEAFKDDEGIYVPKVYWEVSGRRVLTLQTLPGENVDTLLRRDGVTDEKIDRRLIARRLADCYLKQVFEIGVFHADPHPGNILVEPPAGVALIDFGQVGMISEELMTQLVVMVYAAVNREIDVMIDVLADLDALGPATSRRHLHRSLQVMISKYHGLPLRRLDVGAITNEFAEVIRQHDVIIQREVFLLFKAVSTVASLTARLDPDLDLLTLLTPRIKQAMRDRFSPQRLTHGTMVWGWHLLNLARHAPAQLRDFMRGLRLGTWKLHVEHENLERLVRELDRSSNRLAFAVVIAAIIVGSSVVVSAATDMTLLGFKVQYFGVVGYLIAGIMGLGLSWAIFRSGRLH